MKTIDVLTPCYNEIDNIDELVSRIKAVFKGMPGYDYRHIFIDNASTDGTQERIKALSAEDAHIMAIFNVRNFGHIRSPFYGITHCPDDAVICMSSDLQDPPEKIPELVRQWENGYKVVVGVKTSSEENHLVYLLRSAYYRLLRSFSTVEIYENFTGFGLYDRCVIAELKQVEDPYPFFRGLIAELGYPSAKIDFKQPKRKHGKTKNNLRTLYDMAMLGFTSYSKIPLRLAAVTGFILSAICLLVGLFYLIYKLANWQNFQLGIAPLVIGFFFMGSVQLLFLGIIGEYIGSIYTQVVKRPLVIEKERINWKYSADEKKR